MATRSNKGDSTMDVRTTLTKFLNGPLTIRSPIVPNFVAKTRMSLPDLYHDPAAHLPLDDAPARFDDIAEPDLGGHRRDLVARQIPSQPVPCQLPQRQRAHHRIDAEERHPA